MKKIIYAMTLTCMLAACSGEEEAGIFAQKDAYIGDAAAVGSIVKQLDGADQFMQMELYTDVEPYGVQLYYDQLSEKDMLRNATYMFTLIQNVDWVHYTVGEEGYELTRAQLEDMYQIDLRNVHDEEVLEEHIENAQKK